MGGKTQQRVAGNAKPTNSGRIRELLLNQQMGPGNIITFSALSGKNQPKTQPKSQDATVSALKATTSSIKDGTENNLTKNSATDQQQEKPKSILPETSTLSKDNTRLVVRRVGNRDLYTRVRLTDDQDINDESLLPSAVQPSDAGVKKPPQELLNQAFEQTFLQTGVDEEKVASDAISTEKGESDVPEEKVQQDPDEQLDFDGLLDRLEAAKALVDADSNSKTLRELNSTSIEHEGDLLKLSRIMIRKFVTDMSIEDWDLVSRTLNKWVNWISKANYPLQETYQAEFCASVFMFIHQLIVQAERIKDQPDEISSFPLMQSLLDDWANFRSSSMFLDLITLYLKLINAENADSAHLNPTIKPMLEALAHIIISVDTRVVLSHHNLLDYLSTKVEFDQEFKKPKNSTFCGVDSKHYNSFAAVCGLLRSNLRVTLVTGHAILSKTMTTICENTQSSMLMQQDQEAVDDVLIFPPEPLVAILTSRDSMMSALLSDYRVGDISVTIEPNTDSYACTLSYLFAWDLTIQFIVGVDKELGQCIIHSLKRLGLIQRLLDNIFMLLPPLDDRDSLNFKIESNDKNGEDETHTEWNINSFLKSALKTTVKRPVNEIELVALHLYFSVASHMPVTVRKWYNNNANKRLCNLVNEYTVKHISQVICSLEMESVQKKCQERANKQEPTNLTIKARPSAKEVYAIYTRDEFKMELTIKLPQNYPLGPVQIDGGKRVGVTDVKWRSWLLQLTTFLSHQNGPILDGIDLWKTNIDKRFEGVEKCTICFSILHSNYQLPKKRCQTCANMFHNLCLYKWFESSGNSTCPLCRNPW
uniref:E3 ubiquitin-protein ligase listerin n=2 Tax=Aceria tosichella TaxID=561515 RepID=A0A6G1SB46_9ACAR